MLKQSIAALALGAALFTAGQAMAADYVIDKEGQHAFVNFKISHLGYSWLYGTFKDFDGSFSFDAKSPEASKVKFNLNTASLDSNHAERDKHLRSDDFLSADKFPEAKFVSTSYKPNGDGTGTLTGDLTLKDVTKPVEIKVKEIGAGQDPWGGFRRGFEGSTKFALADYGITFDLGPASKEVELTLAIEGKKK